MTFKQYILQERPLCELPMCALPSAVVLDAHTPEMMAVCQMHADLDEANERISPERYPEDTSTAEEATKPAPRPLGAGSSLCKWYDERARNESAYEWDRLQALEHAQRELQAENDDYAKGFDPIPIVPDEPEQPEWQ